jgi:outer membrane cobalamin receptor
MPRWPRTRALALGALATLALVGACEARMPTAAEIDALDVTRTEAVLQARTNHIIYTVDGRVVTAEEARAIPAEKIVSVAVTKGGPGPDRIAIVTREAAAPSPGADVAVARTSDAESFARTAGTSPIILIDGVRSDDAALKALRADQIESVEVIKGAAARERFNELQADQGVILVITKAGHR